MTRAILSAITLDFLQAFEYHPLFLLALLIFLYFVFDGCIFNKKIDIVLISIVASAFIVVWVLRMIGIIPCL